MYVSGLFNGFLDKAPSHRARTPNPLAITVPTSSPRPAALDIERGIYYRRSIVTSGSTPVDVEQRW